nr:peptidoglycan DD-metalloendopeptidase family protein [Acinetobacter sp. Marseille-Q1620]
MNSYHIVKDGDTLWGISKYYHKSVKELAKINSLTGKKIHQLKVGQKIYLENTNDVEDKYEVYLKIILMDLAFKPINKATLKLVFDDKEVIKKVVHGSLDNIAIEDHAKGIKVYFKNIQGAYDLIADHKSLPLGKKVLRLTSRKVKVEGKHYIKDGLMQYTLSEIKRTLKAVGKPILDGIGSVFDNEVKKVNTGNTNSKDNNIETPPEKNEQKRTDSGNSTHIVALQFTEDNFLLNPVNNKYRAYIIGAAKKHGFAPHALAAFINAEAAKKKGGEWDEKSYNQGSKAGGLTQFLPNTWLEMCANQSSLVGQYVSKNPKLSLDAKLNLRFNAELAIDAAAAYAVYNFKISKLPYQNLTEPSSMAKLAYLLHHEGAGGGRQFVQNSFSQERAKALLFSQIQDKKKSTDYLKRFNNDAKAAYGAWLRNYIDGHINIFDFVVDNQKTNQVNISLDETIKLLNGTSISEPQPKLLKEQDSSKNNQSNTTATIEDIRVGGDDSWHDPLAICKLRTAGLASAKGATFGKVRNNGKTNHQGVDLQANPGTTIYAVCSGIVVVAENTNGAYGNVVVIKVNIDDLPEPQQKNAKSKLGEKKFIFFFYAHLSNISVSKNDPVKVGDALGATGSTGNANTMTTIANGAHLHFEARSEARLGLGLSGRIDPIPFLSVKLAY